MMTLLLLAAQPDTATWDGLPIPDAVGVPAARYITCISDPVLDVMEDNKPQDPAAAKAMMDRTLADCRPVRRAVTMEIDAKLANTPGWTDPAVRHARVGRMLDAAEERVAFTAIDREGFSRMIENVRQCVKAGRQDCADKPPRTSPSPRK